MAGARYDAIVVGGGHNGLTTAAYLAKAGRRVLVVERRELLGGLAAGEEFHPGYRTSGLLHDTSGLRPRVVRELDLASHGLVVESVPPPVLSPSVDGPGLLLSHDPASSSDELARLSSGDADRYGEYRRFLGRLRDALGGLLEEAPPDPFDGGARDRLRAAATGLALRRLGTKDMMEVLRIGPMCVADYLNEWFENESISCLLAARAVSGSWMGPWSPGTNANLLRWELAASGHVRGGPARVVDALAAAARAHGAEIRTDAEVEEIRVGSGRVLGVTLAGGETLDAPIVAASCDPRSALLRLVRPGAVPPKLAHRLDHFRMRGTTAKVHLALSGPARFSGREDVAFAQTGATLDGMERAFDPIKYGEMSSEPLLDVHVPSLTDPSLAPEGHAVVSILVHFVPHALRRGWSNDGREALGDRVVEVLARYVPELRERIVAREVLTPVDIADRYAVTGGHVHHGEHALDQLLVRPAPECARHATPIDGLFLCGSGTHPGGGVTAAPGMIAAGAILGH